MGIRFSLIFERTMFFCSFLATVLNWFLQLLFDKFDCIFIVNSLDLKYKKETKLFSGVSKVSYILGYKYKNLGLKVSYGPYCTLFLCRIIYDREIRLSLTEASTGCLLRAWLRLWRFSEIPNSPPTAALSNTAH